MASKSPSKKPASASKKTLAGAAKTKSPITRLAAKLNPLKNAILGKGKKVEKTAPVKAGKKAAAPVKAVTTKAVPTKAVAAKAVNGKKGAAAAPVAAPSKDFSSKDAAKAVKAAAKAAMATSKSSTTKNKGVLPLGAYAGKAMSSVDSMCREVACEGLATAGGYCRLHYIKNWKKIKRKELILKEKKLNQYIEELVAKYPDKYIEAIRQDLANDKDFAKVIHDLDLDESVDDFDIDGESDNLIDNIKRDFDDDTDF